jgi:hypothetical protein
LKGKRITIKNQSRSKIFTNGQHATKAEGIRSSSSRSRQQDRVRSNQSNVSMLSQLRKGRGVACTGVSWFNLSR